jgi:hypothetical protein
MATKKPAAKSRKKQVELKALTRKVKVHLQKVLDYSWDDEWDHYSQDADDSMFDADENLDLAKVVKDTASNHIFVSLAVVQEWLDQQ